MDIDGDACGVLGGVTEIVGVMLIVGVILGVILIVGVVLGVIDGVGVCGIKGSTEKAQINDASKFSISNKRLSPDSFVNVLSGDRL